MPLVVFLLLFVLLLMLVGLACACLTDQPMQAVERALTVLSELAAVVDAWSPQIVAAFAASLLLVAQAIAFGRASPAQLQRFLL